MAWFKVAWIAPFFAALNERFPRRTKATDGTIGNPAHQSSPSGHNPDDTPGSKPEREDADTKPEVRAADASSALGDPTYGMQDVVDAILRTPADRDRLIYIIFNGWIWRKSGGWRREVYAGSDKHRTHIHLSGDPAADDNAAPWTSILNLGGDMPLSQAEKDEIVYRTATIVMAGIQPAGWADQTAPEPYRGQLKGAATNARLVELVTALGVAQKELAGAVAGIVAELAEIREALRTGGTDLAVLEEAVTRVVERIRVDVAPPA